MRAWAFIALFVLSGCAAITSPMRLHDVPNPERPHVIDFSAERRGAVLVTKNERGWSDQILCAEPSPDVTYNLATQVAGKGSYAGIGAEADVNHAYSAVQLAGRTQAIRFLEVCLYRLCEAFMNGSIRLGDTAPIYRSVIVAAASIAESGEREAKAQAIVALGSMDVSREARAAAIRAILGAGVANSGPEVVRQVFDATDQGSSE